MSLIDISVMTLLYTMLTVIQNTIISLLLFGVANLVTEAPIYQTDLLINLLLAKTYVLHMVLQDPCNIQEFVIAILLHCLQAVMLKGISSFV